MADSQLTVALSIGSQRVSAGVFSQAKSGGLVLQNFIIRTISADPAMESVRIQEIRQVLQEIAKELKLSGTKTFYCISGQNVFIRFIKLPPIEGGDVDQLVRFEAQQHVPFPLDEVIWDYHMLPTVGAGKEAILVAVKEDVLNDVNELVCDAKLKPVSVSCAQVALYNAFRASYPDISEPVVLIDIGSKSSNLVYIEGERFYTRSVAVGGAAVTSAIAKEYNTSFEEAENSKIQHGLISLGGAHAAALEENVAALAMVVRSAMTRLATEIQRTTTFYRSQNAGNAPVRAFLCGGGAVLPYTKEFLEERLGLPVQFFNPLHGISISPKSVDGEALSRQAYLLGEVIGMAWASQSSQKVEIDLVPGKIAQQREATKKKPYILIGVGLLVLGSIAYAVCSWFAATEAKSKVDKIVETGMVCEQNLDVMQKLSKKEVQLDQRLAVFEKLQIGRTGYSDVIQEIVSKTATDALWVVDFDPIVGFNPGEKSGMTGVSVIADGFPSSKYGQAAFSVPTPIDQKAKGTDPAAAKKSTLPKEYVAADAIRLRGFVLKKEGTLEQVKVKEFVENLKQSDLFSFAAKDTDRKQGAEASTKVVELEPAQYMSVGETGKATEGSLATPFTVILPLKNPIPLK